MIDREVGNVLYKRYKEQRAGLRNEPLMESVCLICASVDVVPVGDGDPTAYYCRNCGFKFHRYRCELCGGMVDSRDPERSDCKACGRN